MMNWNSKYFYGHEISAYGLEHGYIDYGTLAKAFNAVLNNDILATTDGVVGYWEQVSGFVDHSDEIEDLEELIEETEDEEEIERLEAKIDELRDEEDYFPEVFQWYIVTDNGAEILKEFNEIVYYNVELDMYLWGVTHYGTAWDYVLTDCRIVLD